MSEKVKTVYFFSVNLNTYSYSNGFSYKTLIKEKRKLHLRKYDNYVSYIDLYFILLRKDMAVRMSE